MMKVLLEGRVEPDLSKGVGGTFGRLTLLNTTLKGGAIIIHTASVLVFEGIRYEQSR